jgi:hypothetical protein
LIVVTLRKETVMVTSFPRRLARLVLAGALVAVLSAVSARPTTAVTSTGPCAYVTGGRAEFVNNGQQQLTIHVNENALLALKVRLSNGQTLDATTDPNTTYSTNGAGVIFAGGFLVSYHATPQDANKTFPIYAKYFDPCKGVTWTFTMSLHVIP